MAQDDSDSVAAIHRSLGLGVNWIDMPRPMGSGHSKEIAAQALKSCRAKQHGARILHLATHYLYGERQYTFADFEGHRWTFSQSIADVDPKDWATYPANFGRD